MKVKVDRVYLFRTAIDGNVAPFTRYAEVAHDALSCLDLDLPADGTLAFKPNITIPAEPDTRIVTHPGFVVGLLRRLLELGISRERLVVMEAWGTPHADAGRRHHHADQHRRRANFPEHGSWRPHGHLPEVSGYDAALAALGLSLTNHDHSDGVDVPLPDGVVFRHLRLTHHAAQAGFLFNVPVAKCHNLSCTTLSTKNLQGLALSPQRHMCTIQAEDEGVKAEDLTRITDSGLSLHEERFCHKHADLVIAVRRTGVPRLCVVDGLIGRDGTAFNEGRNHPLGWVLIGDNEVHVDAVGTYLFGLDPEKTPYLQVAAARGLGTNRVAEIEVVDLSSGRSLDAKALAGHRHDPPLMPVARYESGYYPRFRQDGSVVPWALDRVNEQRRADGLEPIPAR